LFLDKGIRSCLSGFLYLPVLRFPTATLLFMNTGFFDKHTGSVAFESSNTLGTGIATVAKGLHLDIVRSPCPVVLNLFFMIVCGGNWNIQRSIRVLFACEKSAGRKVVRPQIPCCAFLLPKTTCLHQTLVEDRSTR
jgi:hypothetical protein